MRTVTYWLSLLMIFLIPWEGIAGFPGLGSASRLMGFVVGASWLLMVIIRRRIRKIAPFHVFVFLFFLWNAISFFWSYDPVYTLARVLTYIRMAGLMLIIWDLYETPAALRAGLQAFVLGSFVPVGNIINNFIVGDMYSFNRYAAAGRDANTSGFIIALALPIAFFLVTWGNRNKTWQVLKLANYAYIPTAAFAMALTGTRFAMIMSLPALLFGVVALTQLKFFSRILTFMFLLGTLLFLPSIIPEASMVRLSSAGDEIMSGDLTGRTGFWKNGLKMWVEQPILGIGSGAFPSAVAPIYGRPRSMHNSFLAVLVETGLIGFILFGSMLATAVYQIMYLPRWEARFWVTIVVVWGLGNMAMTWVHANSTWLLLSLLFVGAANQSRQQGASRSPAEA